MKEQVGCQNLFFRHDKGVSHAGTMEQRAEHSPSPVFIYNTEDRTIEYANGMFTNLAGCQANTRAVNEVLKKLIHPADFPGFQKFLSTGEAVQASRQGQFIARLRTDENDFRVFSMEGTSIGTER